MSASSFRIVAIPNARSVERVVTASGLFVALLDNRMDGSVGLFPVNLPDMPVPLAHGNREFASRHEALAFLGIEPAREAQAA